MLAPMPLEPIASNRLHIVGLDEQNKPAKRTIVAG